MRRTILAALAVMILTLGPIVLWGSSNAQAQSTPTPSTWGAVKAMYGVSNSAQTAPVATDGARESSVPSPYQPWTCQSAQMVMGQFHVNASEILAVQKVVALRNGVPIDSAEAVVTDRQWYYVDLSDNRVHGEPPDGFRTATEMDVYGSYLALINNGSYCQTQEWDVVFFMPACLHYNGNGFNEVVDAWAPAPYCNWGCNGGFCALWKCGPAWDGSGTRDWYNYKDCSSTTSRKVGKLVQKRWMYTWNQCYGYSFDYIARTVRARIRF